MGDLEELVEDTVDEIITAVRKEHTNFDDVWLPQNEFILDAQSTFVKFVGYNIVVCQDKLNQVYFFSGDELKLEKKISRKFQLFDAFGSKEFICLSLDKRNLQFFDRETLEVV